MAGACSSDAPVAALFHKRCCELEMGAMCRVIYAVDLAEPALAPNTPFVQRTMHMYIRVIYICAEQ